MKQPGDQGVIESGHAANPCAREAEPWILAAVVLGSSVAFIDSTVVNVALLALQSSLGGTVIDMQWVVEAYGLFLGALILVGGSTGDLLGRRRMFLFGVTVFAVASAACGLAPNIRGLVIARAVQGMRAAFLVPGSLSIIGASFSAQNRGRAIGTWSGFTSITAALGPVLGGWLIEHASWRWAFFINLPLAAAVIALSLWRVPESRHAASGNTDWAGALVSAFSFRLNRSLQGLAISPTAMQDLRANETRLAALTVPVEIDAEMVAAIRVSVERAFVSAFRLAMMICAGLSIASSSFAWGMIASPSSLGRQLHMSEAT